MEKEYFVLYTPNDMNKAYELMESDFSTEEILDFLIGNDDILKQVSLIKLKDINSQIQAECLVSVLTGQHGPVREICSAKINEFLKQKEKRQYFAGENIRKILLDALNDIIPTVVRNIINVIKYLPSNDLFCEELMDRIIDLKNYKEDSTALSNHEIIKKTFKLYWYLEALNEFTEITNKSEKMKEIIENNYNHEDYTIREKIAKILSKTNDYNEYKSILQKDSNPYVFSYLN